MVGECSVTFATGLSTYGRHFEFSGSFIDDVMGPEPNMVGRCSVTFATGLSTYGSHFGFSGFLLMTTWDFNQIWWGDVL